MIPQILSAVGVDDELDLSGSQSDYQSKGRDLGSLWRQEENPWETRIGGIMSAAMLLKWPQLYYKSDRIGEGYGIRLEFSFIDLELYGIAVVIPESEAQ